MGLVEQAGGVVKFYKMEKGSIKPIDKLELEHYNPNEKQVGFVAGNKKIAGEIISLLQRI